MRIEKIRQREKLTMKISGRLQTSTAPAFRKEIESELESTMELCIDMKNLEYVSSAGLRELLAATKKMDAKGGSMKVCHVNQEIMDVFQMTGFDGILHIR